MFEEYQICPYTGLRSFTEEESLYFKGREEHIDQATEQLQRNKFLMLTGASGDGKSSLIYAGIIPNARSGFLKSRYTNWSVADFRPERTPFANMCGAIARELGIEDPLIVQSELQHGFSALVDLYKNSKRYVDPDSVEWVNADEKGRAALKRDAGNLIVLVDQFEEFFTNPENYQDGVPLGDSELVLNLLLETARIALEEDLPIYVVFTMRSDYIGQCAAFRGLPEYIGFSQFFVPRLNRTQLQLVIEEPAVLSGNKITRRLTERLIHDVVDGVDQLPILQHALNQIWVAAANGEEEMDLIHYAMVGGMAADELPDDQVARFREWFDKLPEKIRECYHGPRLQNVLDTHVSKLYEQTADYFREKSGKEIADKDAKTIVRTAFTCLTKIDQSRAVRNRMTLFEISEILGIPGISPKDICEVLNIYREPGNTFIRPFIKEDDKEHTLSDDQVLDITHESLIRNWQYLGTWAEEEYDDYMVFLDFEKQLDRWVSSGKSSDYLLSIGPLTYFESWYDRVNPNAAWIARYLPEESSKSEKLEKASQILENSHQFLRRSARSHIVTRTVMRYGARKMAAVVIVALSIVFLSFIGTEYYKRQNAYVLDNIEQQVQRLTADADIDVRTRGFLIAEQLKIGKTTLEELVKEVNDPVERANMLVGTASVLVYYGRDEPEKLILECFKRSSDHFDGFPPDGNEFNLPPGLLNEMVDFGKILELAYYYNPSAEIDSFRMTNARRLADHVLTILTLQPAGFDEISDLNMALDFGIMHQVFSKSEINQLISILSPFESLQSAWVRNSFHRDNIMVKGFFDNGLNFNGLFQELAYLYGALGNHERATQAVDSCLKYNRNYFQGDYTYFMDNAYIIAAVFYKYGQYEPLEKFVNDYCRKVQMSSYDFYARLLGRSKQYEYATTVQNVDPRYGFDVNLILEFSPEDQLNFFYEKYREHLRKIGDKDQRVFLTAVSYKDQAINLSKQRNIKGLSNEAYYPLFKKAVDLYLSVDQSHLDEEITIISITQNDSMVISRKYLFLYPDIKTPFHPNEPILFHFNYTSQSFLDYVLNHEMFERLYPTLSERKYFELYFKEYGQVEREGAYHAVIPVSYENLIKLEAALAGSESGKNINLSLLYLLLSKESFLHDDKENLIKYASRLEPEKVKGLFLNAFRGGTDFFFQVGETVKALYSYGLSDEAYRVVKLFENLVNRSSLYAYAATELMREGVHPDEVDHLIDSAILEMNRITDRNAGNVNRNLIAFALAMTGKSYNVNLAYEIIKNRGAKWFDIRRICFALGYNQQMYNAVSNIPEDLSSGDYSVFTWYILNGYNYSSEIPSVWNTYDKYEEPALTHWINNINEAN